MLKLARLPTCRNTLPLQCRFLVLRRRSSGTLNELVLLYTQLTVIQCAQDQGQHAQVWFDLPLIFHRKDWCQIEGQNLQVPCQQVLGMFGSILSECASTDGVQIASRIDNFSEMPTSKFGEALKRQVEERIEFYASGATPAKNADVMKSAMDLVLADIDTEDPTAHGTEDVVMADGVTGKATEQAIREKKKEKKEKKEKKSKHADEEEATEKKSKKDKKRKHADEEDGEKKKKKKSKA